MKRFPRRERIPFPPLLIICSYKTYYIFAIFFPSLADSKRAFLALPCRESIRRLSASASWESHPRALARTLSSQYHHSSRLSSPPSGAVPDGRTLVRRLADLSAAVVLYRINWYSIVKDQSCATGYKIIRLPGATLCNACPIWSRRLFECLENPLHNGLFFCRQRLGYLFK